jgi:hypothetical protein
MSTGSAFLRALTWPTHTTFSRWLSKITGLLRDAVLEWACNITLSYAFITRDDECVLKSQGHHNNRLFPISDLPTFHIKSMMYKLSRSGHFIATTDIIASSSFPITRTHYVMMIYSHVSTSLLFWINRVRFPVRYLSLHCQVPASPVTYTAPCKVCSVVNFTKGSVRDSTCTHA